MRFLKYVVVSNAKSIGLFPAAMDPGLFCGISDSVIFPEFSFSDPVLYRRSYAKFLVHELRRAGYYVTARPYVFYMLRRSLLCMLARVRARKAAKGVWRK